MALLLFCLFIFLCLWLLRDFDFSRLFNILVLSFFIYYFFSFANFFFGGNVFGYRQRYVELEMGLLNSFLVGLIAARWLRRGKMRAEPKFPAPAYKGFLVASYSMIIAGIILYALFVYRAYGGFRSILAITDRHAFYQKKKGWGSLLIGQNIFFAGVLMRIAYYMLYRKTVAQRFPFIAMFIAICMLGFLYLNGERSAMLFFILPLVVMYLYMHRRLKYYLLVIGPILLLLMQVIAVKRNIRNQEPAGRFTKYYHNQRLLPLYVLMSLGGSDGGSAARQGSDQMATARQAEHLEAKMEQANKMLDALAIIRQSSDLSKHGEFTTPGKVDMKVEENLDSIRTRFGGTYVDVLRNLPPSWLAPRRPALPAEWYVRTYYPDESRRGGGFGFSIVSEAVINFSLAGPFIYGLLLGLLLLFLEERLVGASFFYFIIYCLLAYYVFIAVRSGIAGIVKPVLVSVVLPILIAQWVARNFFREERSQ